MTQAEFAKFMGVSQGMISKWESEYYNFTIETLANICEKLDWDMNIELKPNNDSSYSSVNDKLPSWHSENNCIKVDFVEYDGVA